MVDFLVKIQEVKAKEREDAVFECVLSNPFSKILWFGKNVPLEQGDKYDIEVSEDKLIHRLVVKDCMVVDKGIYSACAGIKSCNAWLVVEGKIYSINRPTDNTQECIIIMVCNGIIMIPDLSYQLWLLIMIIWHF